ncbi:unnamed protein product [Caenorhabditis sp. 36 PRJEB53466]|nr:unnamed protein product [Caenorhabditis sp. 36 PRJEB53466]
MNSWSSNPQLSRPEQLNLPLNSMSASNFSINRTSSLELPPSPEDFEKFYTPRATIKRPQEKTEIPRIVVDPGSETTSVRSYGTTVRRKVSDSTSSAMTSISAVRQKPKQYRRFDTSAPYKHRDVRDLLKSAKRRLHKITAEHAESERTEKRKTERKVPPFFAVSLSKSLSLGCLRILSSHTLSSCPQGHSNSISSPKQTDFRTVSPHSVDFHVAEMDNYSMLSSEDHHEMREFTAGRDARTTGNRREMFSSQGSLAGETRVQFALSQTPPMSQSNTAPTLFNGAGNTTSTTHHTLSPVLQSFQEQTMTVTERYWLAAVHVESTTTSNNNNST